ncbi:MAG: choice-of-anchor tandem repeat GloVer-containing protein [Candidatus Sulfotelmatobacter sp.]
MTRRRSSCPRAVLVFATLFQFLFVIQAAAATEEILHTFSSQKHGALPNGLVADSFGNLYGTTQYGGTLDYGTVFKLAPKAGGGWTQTVLHSFLGGADAVQPIDPVLDSAGNIYGVAQYGAPGGCNGGCSTIFEVSPKGSGWVESVLYTVPPSVGYATGALLPDGEGNLYGASGDGSGGCSVFKLTPSSGASWTLTTLYTFSGGNYTAQVNSLVMDDAGNLYGTVSNTASAPQGLAFELQPSSGSWTEKVLYTFSGGSTGGVPTGNLFLHNSNLYGATVSGGSCCGVVFQLAPGAGGHWSENVLYVFPNAFEASAYPGLGGFDSQGNLYGFTLEGGTETVGSVFELTPNGKSWTETDLSDFTGQGDGDYPTALTLGPAGEVYGTEEGFGLQNSLIQPGAVFAVSQKAGAMGASAITQLYTFPFSDGDEPLAGLISDAAGNLYGTTWYGGRNDLGSVFELSPSGQGWKENLIYSFGPPYDALYFNVQAGGLAFDAKGNLYGTTGYGGAAHAGTVYELSPAPSAGWQEKNLFTFTPASGLGQPVGSVVFDKAGHIYGVSAQGGTGKSGTVFEMTQSGGGQWTLKVIYSFAGYPTDGALPLSGLSIDSAGNLYGTTSRGGSGDCRDSSGTVVGCGTAFELSYAAGTGWTETVLHSFLGYRSHDGQTPAGSLILDGSGNLYGTTFNGGTGKPMCVVPIGCGTVFELSPGTGGWNESILHDFLGGAKDGSNPSGPLLRDTLGNLYGNTGDGGANNFGTVFKLVYSGGTWTESVLISFQSGPNDGIYPTGALAMDTSGNVYGTTGSGGAAGGACNCGEGIVFEIKP